MSRRNKSNHSISQNPIQKKVIQEEKQQSIKQQSIKQQDSHESLNFTKVSQLLPIFVFSDILRHSTDEISNHLDKIQSIQLKINEGIEIKDSQRIINYIDLLIEFKESVLKLLSWSSIVVNLVYSELENEYVLTYTPNVVDYLINVNESLDTLLLNVPPEPVFGITLAPDQKQFSETKAMISKVISRVDEIQKENQEAEADWGIVEQNAYERMQEDGYESVTAEDFLSWLSDLKEGKDV